MSPNISSTEPKILTEKDFQKDKSSATQNRNEIYTKTEGWFKTEPKWLNIIFIIFLHLYFIYVCLTFKFLENLKTTALSEYSLKYSVKKFLLL